MSSSSESRKPATISSLAVGKTTLKSEKICQTYKSSNSYITLTDAVITQIARGTGHSLLLTSDNVIYSEGNNVNGEAGQGETFYSVPSPLELKGLEKIAGNDGSVVKLVAGHRHTLVLYSNGNVVVFGDNAMGQLGISSGKKSSHPVLLKALKGKVQDVQARGNVNAVLTKSGEVYLWGEADGLIPKPLDTPTKFAIPKLSKHSVYITEIALGQDHILARNRVGEVFAMGSGVHGQLGVINNEKYVKWVLCQHLTGHKIKKLAAGNGFSVVLSQYGALFAFGRNDKGQLGIAHNGTVEKAYLPRPVAELHHKRIINIQAAENFAVAVTDEQEIYTWGSVTADEAILSKPTRVGDNFLLNGGKGTTKWISRLHVTMDLAIVTLDESVQIPTRTKENEITTTTTPRFEISLECSGLPNLDITSLTDPYVIGYLTFKRESKQFIEFDTTEYVTDDLNPKFAKTFNLIDYTEFHKFSGADEGVFVRLDMYDIDETDSEDMRKQEYIDYVEFSLSDLKAQGTIKTTLTHIKKTTVTVRKVDINPVCLTQNNLFFDNVSIHLKASGLPKKDLLGRSDPYFVISRKSKAGDEIRVFRSDIVMSDLSPTWDKVCLPLQRLSNGDNDSIKIDVYDYDRFKGDDFIGSVEATVQELLVKPGDIEKVLTLQDKVKKGVGKLHVMSFDIQSATI